MSSRPPTGPSQPAQAKTRLPGILLIAALVLLVAYVTYNTATGERGSSTGPLVGAAMAEFAAPLVTSSLQGDVNVTQRGAASGGVKAACQLHGAGVLNSCELVRGHGAVLVFIDSSEGRCADTLDQVVQAAEPFPALPVAAVVIAGERSEARALVASHGWKIPVAEDRDGALANLYGVAVCPQIVYLKAGGVVAGVTVGGVSGAELNRQLRALERTG